MTIENNNRITMHDIAVQANVSTMTVSRALSGKGRISQKTAERIKKIARDLGYEPNLIAQALSSKRSYNIGVIIPRQIPVFLDNFNAQVLTGILNITDLYGYRITFVQVDPEQKDENRYLKHAANNMLDGLILLRSKIGDPNIPRLAEKNFPYIMVNHKMNPDLYNFVDTENVTGAKLAVEYLYNRGYRRIACVVGAMDETNSLDRMNGYREAVRDLNLPYDDSLIVYGEFSDKIAYENIGKLLKEKIKPDAIFCSDDVMAAGVINRIKSEGLSIPEDIAVIGYDDQQFTEYLKPRLTTIQQPMEAIGESAAELIIRLIEKSINPPVHKILNVRLIERESC